jgi:hypothetical protein
MHTLTRHFAALLSGIEPPKSRQETAETLPERVREYLEAAEEFATEDPHTRLAGSYRRHTAICDIKDVDIIVCCDDSRRGEDPSAVLTSLAAALRGLPGGGDPEIRPQRRSVRVDFGDGAFLLDVVPALLPGGVSSPLEVPDREQQEWLLSHPLGYCDRLSQLNEEHDGKLVRLIKLVKYWRNHHMVLGKPKSYVLEAKIVQLVTEGRASGEGTSYAEFFTAALQGMDADFAPWDSAPFVPDPMLGHDVAEHWPDDDFRRFRGKLSESVAWCEEALREDDRDECKRLWCKVFGDAFVTTLGESAKAVANVTRYTTATGLIHSDPFRRGSIPVPNTRFYGA